MGSVEATQRVPASNLAYLSSTGIMRVVRKGFSIEELADKQHSSFTKSSETELGVHNSLAFVSNFKSSSLA